MLPFANFRDLSFLAVPHWVTVVSLFILRRERGRVRLPRRESGQP